MKDGMKNRETAEASTGMELGRSQAREFASRRARCSFACLRFRKRFEGRTGRCKMRWAGWKADGIWLRKQVLRNWVARLK